MANGGYRPCARTVSDLTSPSRWRAAELLDQVGTAEDIPRLRALAKTVRSPSARTALGRGLARKLADRFLIEDLGRVEVVSGDQHASATSVRRKVLAMLCFLLTKPRFSATRDEVIDALWPDLSPDVAVNSLNQTVYFLRRVFEPTYVEDLSARLCAPRLRRSVARSGAGFAAGAPGASTILDRIGSELIRTR